jgi:DNA invertase Pin-like site-specific DNA recombinase
MSRTRRERPTIELPKPSPHWHPPGCACKPAVPYIRVSKVGKREKIISPKMQLDAIEAYAKANNLRLLEPVCDIDKSGRTFRRRSIGALIGRIAAGEFQQIVVWKWSRWARNIDESAIYVKQVRDAGGRVDSATEDQDQDTAVGRLQHIVTGAFDEYQSNLISETWRNVHSLRRDDGLPHGGRDRFGYDYVTEGRGQEKVTRYVPNDEAPILRQGYEDYADGKSFSKIAQDWHRAGTFTTLGGTWTPQAVARTMDTGFAAGLIRERSKPSAAPANSILSYDVWRAGIQDPIIERPVWDAYKERRLKQAGLPPRSRRPVHALSTLLFCTECRRRLVTKYSGVGRTHQWQCPWQKTRHPGVAVTVNNRLALLAVREWVGEVLGEQIDIAAAQAAAEAELAERERRQETEQQRIRREIAALDGKIDNLLDHAESAHGRAKEKIDARLQSYEQEIERLTALLKPEPLAPDRVFGDADQAALQQLDAVWGELPPTVLNEFLSKLLSRIEVAPRSGLSTRKSASDRVSPVPIWEGPELDSWLAERPA